MSDADPDVDGVRVKKAVSDSEDSQTSVFYLPGNAADLLSAFGNFMHAVRHRTDTSSQIVDLRLFSRPLRQRHRTAGNLLRARGHIPGSRMKLPDRMIQLPGMDCSRSPSAIRVATWLSSLTGRPMTRRTCRITRRISTGIARTATASMLTVS